MDWAPGDLALCVRIYHHDGMLRIGARYTVTDVIPADEDAIEPFGLVLAEVARSADFGGLRASCFIKVTPLDPDEFDLEWIADSVCVPSPVFTSADHEGSNP